MAIGASGRLPVAGGHGFSMNTFLHILGYLDVTSAAGFGKAGEMERGCR
jgi:hypothetical protein